MGRAYDAAPVALRPELREALNRAHDRLAATGSWLDAEQRLAIVAETRRAWSCVLCAERKNALSPYAVEGDHDTLGQVPAAWVGVIHRLTTDSGRLSERWYREALDAGVLEDELIEMISVVVQTVVIDCFTSGIGMEPPPFAGPAPGQPQKQHRSEAKTGPGWAATIAPEDATPDFADFYANESHFYIRRSLTLVPDETRRLWDLLNNMYMEDPRLFELDGLERGISRAQMEFLAARASALLGCYY